MWGFKDSDCPQENDVFTYEAFADLAPASIIKLFWEYNDGVVVESCHDVHQFITFLKSPMRPLLDPNVQLPISEEQMRASYARQRFVESSVIAVLLAYLVRKGILPRSVGQIAEQAAQWEQSFARWNTIEGARELNEITELYVPRYVQEADPVAYARRPETVTEYLAGVVSYSKLLYVAYSYVASLVEFVNEGARSRGHREISWSNPDVLIPLLAFVIILTIQLHGLNFANNLLKSLRSYTGFALPSAETIFGTYVATGLLL
jgi:hypothetical protein